ncbi:MAG: hypothetical protein ACREHD_10385 [Pirellulales bacterium]
MKPNVSTDWASFYLRPLLLEFFMQHHIPRGNSPKTPDDQRRRRESLVEQHAAVIGRPRFERLLVEGFHPIRPDRTLVLRTTEHGFVDADLLRLCQQVGERLIPTFKERCGYVCAPEKLGLLVRAMDTVARHYQIPDTREAWSYGLAARESLGSTGFGKGMGLLHQFQGPGPEHVATDCDFVDWWLFLIPEGADFDSFDEKPVYTLVGHVFSRFRERYLAQIHTWALTTRIASAVGEDWFRELAQKQPEEAAREYNERLFWAMDNTDW